MHPGDTARCFGSMMGLYAAEPTWLSGAVQAIQAGLWPTMSADQVAQRTQQIRESQPYQISQDGTAIISILGAMSKNVSKFGGTSTVMTRRAIRIALTDKHVKSILLAIDSPGGQVSGVSELADEIRHAGRTKPTHAYCEDLCASAGYWVASQASRITANRSGQIGSIGCFAVLHDMSGMAEREGIKVHVVSTGPHKGLGAPGTSITPELLDEVQAQVDTVGQFFFEAVQSGRRLSNTRLREVSDGRVWFAEEAKRLGLIDEVQSFEGALAAVASLSAQRTTATGRQAELVAMRTAFQLK